MPGRVGAKAPRRSPVHERVAMRPKRPSSEPEATSVVPLELVSVGGWTSFAGQGLAISSRTVAIRRQTAFGPIGWPRRPRSELLEWAAGTRAEVEAVDWLPSSAHLALQFESRAEDARYLVLRFAGNPERRWWAFRGTPEDIRTVHWALQWGERLSPGGAVSAPRPHGGHPLVLPLIVVAGLLGALGTILLASALVSGGDEAAAVQQESDSASPVPPTAPADVSPLAPRQLPRIAADLTRTLGGPPDVYRIVADDVQATFQVYSPDDPRIVDRWLWQQGELTGPNPDGRPGVVRGTRAAYLLNDVRLRAVAPLARRARRAPGLGDPVQVNVVIRRLFPQTSQVRIVVNAQGPDGARRLVATVRGRVISVSCGRAGRLA
jgi:hypothetical protein